jgi:hypothetical protein
LNQYGYKKDEDAYKVLSMINGTYELESKEDDVEKKFDDYLGIKNKSDTD